VVAIDEILSRFRPVGAPGAAGTTGVSADHAAALAAELDPVLARLAGADTRCAAVAAEAASEAARLTAEAAEQAARITSEARIRANAARKAATNEVVAAARAEAERITQAAAEAVRARRPPAEADVLALVERAVRLVESLQADATVRRAEGRTMNPGEVE
jgi:hypothetical protein